MLLEWRAQCTDRLEDKSISVQRHRVAWHNYAPIQMQVSLNCVQLDIAVRQYPRDAPKMEDTGALTMNPPTHPSLDFCSQILKLHIIQPVIDNVIQLLLVIASGRSKSAICMFELTFSKLVCIMLLARLLLRLAHIFDFGPVGMQHGPDRQLGK